MCVRACVCGLKTMDIQVGINIERNSNKIANIPTSAHHLRRALVPVKPTVLRASSPIFHCSSLRLL